MSGAGFRRSRSRPCGNSKRPPQPQIAPPRRPSSIRSPRSRRGRHISRRGPSRSSFSISSAGRRTSIHSTISPRCKSSAGKPVPQSVRKAVEASKHANVFRDCKDELLASPFKFSQHGQSGMWVSELWPNVARHVDDLMFIHSLQSESNNHAPSSYAMHTGDVRPGKASLGSWVTYGLGSENQDLPGYVALFDAGPLGGAANYSNGFLPAAFQPTRLRDAGIPALDLTPPKELAAGQRASLDLIRELNLKHRAAHAGTVPFSGARGPSPFAMPGEQKGTVPLAADRTVEELDARIASYELAYRMQSAALEVGGLENETLATHRLYGIDQKEERLVHFARKCLLARRLVERGVRFVQVYDMPDKDGWDAHADLHGNHEPRARWIDRPIAALLGRSEAARAVGIDARDLRQRIRPHADDAGQQRPSAQRGRLHHLASRRRRPPRPAPRRDRRNRPHGHRPPHLLPRPPRHPVRRPRPQMRRPLLRNQRPCGTANRRCGECKGD